MLRVYKRDRDKNWRIRGTLFGVTIEESSGTPDKVQAQILCNARIAELTRQHVEGAVIGRRVSISFAEAVNIYIEGDGERRFLAPLLDHFGETPIARIDQAAIDDAARRLLPGRAPATINRQIIAPMSAVLKAAGVSLKIKRRKEPPPRVRWLTQEERSRLVAECNPALRVLVIFLLFTGARIGEALWLDWRNVDLARAHVSFPKTKNGEARGLPLHPEVVAVLASLSHHEGEIFRRPDGLPYDRPDPDDDDDTSAGSRISEAFAGACRRGGIVDFTPHDTRHDWATEHYRQNRDLLGLKQDGGWKTLKMVERYAHVNTEHRRAAIDGLPSLKVG